MCCYYGIGILIYIHFFLACLCFLFHSFQLKGKSKASQAEVNQFTSPVFKKSIWMFHKVVCLVQQWAERGSSGNLLCGESGQAWRLPGTAAFYQWQMCHKIRCETWQTKTAAGRWSLDAPKPVRLQFFLFLYFSMLVSLWFCIAVLYNHFFHFPQEF